MSDRSIQRLALSDCALFAAMPATEQDRILDLSVERSVRRGQVIFQRGDTDSSIMAVLRGSVRISTGSADGKEITLNTISAGEAFGEIALLDNQPRSADATGIEDTRLLVIERRHFLPFLMGNQELALHMLTVLCQRLRQTSEALGDVVMLDLPSRLARLLTRLATDHGNVTSAGVRIGFKLSQHDIGTRVASSRESVNKQLHVWRDAGWLSLDHGYITLHDLNQLRQLGG